MTKDESHVLYKGETSLPEMLAQRVEPRTWGTRLIGPRLGNSPEWLRYAMAVVVITAIAAARAALNPLLGTQSPLLPFLLGVFVSAYLGGRGPALLACALAPLLVIFWFTDWPYGAHALEFAAHAVFFLGIGLLLSLLMHELQLASQRQSAARTRAEHAAGQAQETAARLRLLTDHLPVLIAYLDRQEIYRFTNAPYRKWLQRDPADPPSSLREVLGDALYAERFPYVEAVLRGEVARFEGITPHPTLGPRTCEITYVPEHTPEGVVQGFYVMAQDITERRRAEAALRERERLLNLIYDNASDGLCLLAVESDHQFRFLSVNEAFLQVRGYSADQVTGRLLEEVTPPLNRAMARENCEKAVATHRVLVYKEVADLPAGRRIAEVTLVPIARASGGVAHLLAAYRDITLQEQAQTELREANRRKDEFLAMLAHELRNPLAPIRNVAQILSNEALDAAAVRRSSELLQRQATQLTRLVDDLLDVARITRGAIQLKKERVALERALEMALEAVQPLLDIKHQAVSLKRAPEEVFVEADPVRLCQILTNLLTNAAKYSPEQGQIRVQIECTPAEAFVIVRDQGMGIDPQMLPHIFELFLQGDRSLDRSQGGLGIGLTIAQHLARMHDGRIEAFSAGLGQGSEFRVQLPRQHPPRSPAGPDRSSDDKASRARRVLVVEDNADSAESLAMLLRIAGHEVRVVHEGATALSALEHFEPDLILLDIGLPGIDGYLVAQSIRERFPNLRARLYALTGYGRAEDRDLALAAGFDDHLTKPVDPDRLLKLLTEDRARVAR